MEQQAVLGVHADGLQGTYGNERLWTPLNTCFIVLNLLLKNKTNL